MGKTWSELYPEGDENAGREPPFSEAAEQSVIGSVLLRQDVLPQIIESGLVADDLYLPVHRAIFEAMLSLDARGIGIDTLTLGEELRRSSRPVKDAEVILADLAARVPTAANVGYYVKLVRDHALRRRMIAACGKIQSAAYDIRGDTDAFVESAEADVYEVTRRRERQSYLSVQQLAMSTVSVVEERFNRDREVSGVPSGLDDLDRMTTGFQPKDLILLAGRPSAGKTAMGLNVCLAAALQGIPSLVFSLEMSREALTERLVCCEGRINGQAVRTGRLNRDEWPALVQAAARVSELPIYIDDSGDLTPIALRAKARRWMSDAKVVKREDGLALIVIDYLQMLSADVSESRHESREQQVARISRSLKKLAKELAVPVCALSQLKRPEKNAVVKNGRPQMSDLRECVTGDQVVPDPITGRLVTVRELADKRLGDVYGIDNRWLVVDAVASAWPTGVKPVLCVTTKTGRMIRCTANHPLRTIAGWTGAGEIRVGQRIAAPRRVCEPTHPSNPLTEDEASLLGFMVADGSYGKWRSVSYVKGEHAMVDEVSRIVAARFGIVAKIKACVGIAKQVEFRLDTTGPNKNPLIQWLKGLGIHGQIGPQKRAPVCLFDCDNARIARFLGSLWSGDGSVIECSNGTRSLKFTSTSRGLLDDVMWMLTRLGIIAVRGREGFNQKSKVPIANVTIHDAGQIRHFATVVTLFGEKARKLRAAASRQDIGRNSRVDRFSVEVTKEVGRSIRASGLRRRDVGYRDQGKEICREDLLRVGELLGRTDLVELATSDVLWDEVVSVVPDGEEEVFDLRVPKTGNFIVNNILTHNSGGLEQDADVILFVHRLGKRKAKKDDPVINPEDEDRLAEIIVGKQRNGPTGTVEVIFQREYGRFDLRSPRDEPERVDNQQAAVV